MACLTCSSVATKYYNHDNPIVSDPGQIKAGSFIKPLWSSQASLCSKKYTSSKNNSLPMPGRYFVLGTWMRMYGGVIPWPPIYASHTNVSWIITQEPKPLPVFSPLAIEMVLLTALQFLERLISTESMIHAKLQVCSWPLTPMVSFMVERHRGYGECPLWFGWRFIGLDNLLKITDTFDQVFMTLQCVNYEYADQHL